MEFFQILGDMSGLDDAIRFIFTVIFQSVYVLKAGAIVIAPAFNT